MTINAVLAFGSIMHDSLIGYQEADEGRETSPIPRPTNSSGVLTPDKWRDWFRQKRDYLQKSGDTERLELSEEDQINLDLLTDQTADQQFEIVSQSEFLVENFFTLSRSIQDTVQWLILGCFSLERVVLFASLSHKVQEQNPAIDFVETNGWNLYDYLRDLANVESEKFEDLVQAYEALSKRDSVRTGPVIVLLLTILYGESLIIEVLQRWVDVACGGTPEDFAAVVQDWSNLRKYPLDWIISIIR